MALNVQNLNFKIDDKEILKNVNIKVENKKWVGIIGPNGSGKTSLLKHIYRVLPTKKKTVFLYDKPIENYTYKQSARNITVVKQENVSDFNFKVKDIVLLGRAPHKNYLEDYNKKDKEISEKALASIGMASFSDRIFESLSGGEKQRVLIARSLTQMADIYILDEPTNHLDVYYQWSLMQTIKDQYATVLGVFHEFGLACSFCDYIYVMNNGSIYTHGKPKDIITKELLKEVFKIDADIIVKENKAIKILINGAIQ